MLTKKYYKRLTVALLLAVIVIIAGCGDRRVNGVAPGGEEPAGEMFSFIYMSDAQADPEAGNYVEFGGLVDHALKHESAPQLLVLGGDSVNDGASADEWADFWTALEGRLDNITVASVAGNHDNKPLLAEQFSYPDEDPGLAGGFFYTFTRGKIFFLMLDSNAMGGGNATDAQWLANQLSSEEAVNADWRIAVCHHPFWPVVEVPKDIQRAQTMRNIFLPVLAAGGADLILCGHQHLYARSGEMEGGLVQIMAASGAKESYHPGEAGHIIEMAEVPNYLIVEADANKLTITAYDSAGVSFDSVLIEKRVAK